MIFIRLSVLINAFRGAASSIWYSGCTHALLPETAAASYLQVSLCESLLVCTYYRKASFSESGTDKSSYFPRFKTESTRFLWQKKRSEIKTSACSKTSVTHLFSVSVFPWSRPPPSSCLSLRCNLYHRPPSCSFSPLRSPVTPLPLHLRRLLHSLHCQICLNGMLLPR